VEYIKALRARMGVFAALLALASFRVGNVDISSNWQYILVVCIVVFCATSATMVWNDYQDRDADRAKGKTFASNHANIFLAYATFMWVVTVLAVIALAIYGLTPYMVGCSLVLSGLFYNCFRKIWPLPNIVVALTSANVTLFAPSVDYMQPKSILLLYLGAFLVILAREIVKDIEDVKVDAENKSTLPRLYVINPPKKPVEPQNWLDKLFETTGLVLEIPGAKMETAEKVLSFHHLPEEDRINRISTFRSAQQAGGIINTLVVIGVLPLCHTRMGTFGAFLLLFAGCVICSIGFVPLRLQGTTRIWATRILDASNLVLLAALLITGQL
jgi:hypothetical protein